MRLSITIVLLGLIASVYCACDSKSNFTTHNSRPTITNATFSVLTRVLTVTVSDTDDDDVTVSITQPAGLVADATSRTVAGGQGNATFSWTTTDALAGATGETTISASDGSTTTPVTQVVTIAIPAADPLNITHVAVADLGDGSATLTVTVADLAHNAVTVAVSSPAGMAVDNLSRVVTGGNGAAVFTYTASEIHAGAAGSVAITADDGHGATDSTTQALTIAPVGPLSITAASAVDLGDGRARLTVTIAHFDNITSGVTVTVPPGMTVDSQLRMVPGGNGDAVFTYLADDAAAGATGTVTISADQDTNTASMALTVTIAPVATPAGPVIGAVTWTDNNNGSGTLAVPVTRSASADVTVSVTAVAGASFDHMSLIISGGTGTANFILTEDTAGAGASGAVTITATDGTESDIATLAVVLSAAAPTGPVIGAVTWTDGGHGQGTLSVPVSRATAADMSVSVTPITGATFDQPMRIVSGGTGSVTFTLLEATAGAGASGAVTITADDGTETDTETLTVTLASHIILHGAPVEPDTLYAYPLAVTTTVGTPVTVIVYTGEPANPLTFLSSVGFTVETAGTYVANSFNVGAPGGGRNDTDGYWALLGPPAPGNGWYLDLGDALLPGAPTVIGGGLHRYNFAVITQGPFSPPAQPLENGAILFNFQLTFSTPGTYHLGFQLNDGAFDQTYYSDWNTDSYFWSTLDNSNTITVH